MRPRVRDITAMVAVFLLAAATGCRKSEDRDVFRVAFMTDIHITPQKHASEGFATALRKAEEIKPDFILTGGDLVYDAISADKTTASQLFDLYGQIVDIASVPVYNSLGNHDLYGLDPDSGADPSDPDYAEGMYENRIGESHYTFDHKGWKFIILDSAEDDGEGSYSGFIDQEQVTWLTNLLAVTDTLTPITVVTHIPFVSILGQLYSEYSSSDYNSRIVTNGNEVLELFEKHNLRLVLQGHNHIAEEVILSDTHFITGGAVSGAMWKGAYLTYEEGFVSLTFSRNSFEWEYVDYGWEAGL